MVVFSRHVRAGLAVLVILSIASLVGCAQTRSVDPERQGFLSKSEWALMKETNDDEDVERKYINRNVDWKSYHAVMIDSVSFWRSTEEEKIPTEDSQMILEYFYAALHREIGKRANVVNQPGPGVARLRIAITDAEGAMVAGRVVTTVVPQMRIMTTAGGMATGTSVTVGEAGVAAKVTDSMSDRLLACAADRRLGQKSFKGMTDEWGDLKAAIDIWAETFANDIASRISKARSS